MSHSSAVVPQVAARLSLPGQWTPIGWLAPDGIDFDGWCAIGEALASMTTGVHWWLGDYFAYGEHNYGEKYAQMMDETKFGYSTLSRDRWVAASVHFCRRRQELAFSHHEAVARLLPEEQERWLSRAVMGDGKQRWSVRQLKDEIKAANNPNRDNGHQSQGQQEPAARIERLERENEQLSDALEELADLMDDVVSGEYAPDSFTTQPARTVLESIPIGPPVPMLTQRACPNCGHRWNE